MKVAELAEQTSKGFGKVWEKFDNVDDQFAKVNNRLDSMDDRLAILETKFEVMRDETINEIEKRLDPKFERIYAIMDRWASQSEKHDQEMAMINRQGKRHERWIYQLAYKTETKLQYE